MITNFLLDIIYFFAHFILSLLPTSTLPSAVADFITAGSEAITSFYSTLPITFFTLLTTFGAILIAEGVIALYKAIKWGYNKIPGVN